MFQAYLITRRLSGRRYIGITSQGIQRRWAEHLYDARRPKPRMAITRAIAKYGPEAFTIEALCSARTWGDICAVEPALIAQHESMRPGGYNVATGGEGPFGVKRAPEAVERSAAKHRGRPCHPNTRAAASAFHLGRPKTAAAKAKMAAARLGVRMSPETKARVSAGKLGISCNAGATNGGAKLTADDVAEIRGMLADGATQRSAARRFGVSFTAVWKIANGLKWNPRPRENSPAR